VNYVKVDSEKYNTSLKRYVDDNPSIIEFRAQLYW
jgi:phosphate-selective porin OprO/OprP